MKISINNNIIDTKHIYQVGPIQETVYETLLSSLETMYFNVYLFNVSTHIKVEINLNKRLEGIRNNKAYYLYQRDFGTSTCPYLNEYGIEEKERIVNAARKEINDFRDNIVFLWSNNQSSIPKYRIE